MQRLTLFLLVAALGLAAWSQQPTEVVVTAMASSKGGLATIAPGQVQVQQGHDRDPVVSWLPATGDHARLDLAIVIDDDTSGLAGPDLDDIRHFITALPPSTAIALVYLHTGTMAIAQPITLDHAAALAKLRQPGGSSPSPYGSLIDLFIKWPRHPGRRREMVLISDGEEHIGGNDASNQTFQAAVADAVGGGIVVYPIFAAGSTPNIAPGIAGAAVGAAAVGFGAFNNAALDTNSGLQNLSILAESTGGEAYAQGGSTPTRLQSFLDAIAARLQAQYLLAFTPAPAAHTGLTGLKVEVKDSKAKITAPKQFWARARR